MGPGRRSDVSKSRRKLEIHRCLLLCILASSSWLLDIWWQFFSLCTTENRHFLRLLYAFSSSENHYFLLRKPPRAFIHYSKVQFLTKNLILTQFYLRKILYQHLNFCICNSKSHAKLVEFLDTNHCLEQCACLAS